MRPRGCRMAGVWLETRRAGRSLLYKVRQTSPGRGHGLTRGYPQVSGIGRSRPLADSLAKVSTMQGQVELRFGTPPEAGADWTNCAELLAAPAAFDRWRA